MEHVFYAPAKVNLFLKVLSKRDDGYHNIVSIVAPISLYDVIHVEERKDGEITITDDKNCLPRGQENTIFRAITLLREKYGVRAGLSVHVVKHIPIGSGLGGPSTDAASILKGLSEIWELHTKREELMELGKQIGADVPLFLYGKPCVVKGIGEKISHLRLPRLWYLVLYPNTILKTKDVYEGLRIVLTKDENDIKLIQNFESVQDVADILENDLEKVAILMCPKIETLKDRLMKAGAFGALMSGSGSSVFGVFEREDQVRKAALSFGNGDSGDSVFVVHGVEEGETYGDHRHKDLSSWGEKS